MSAQVFESRDTRIDNQLRRFFDVAADFSLFDDFRFITLLQLLKDI